MSSVSAYNALYNTSASTKKTYYTEDGHAYTLSDKSGSDLNIQDFFQLIAAQLSNQDFNNPTDNTEFMAQMAQFTALQIQQKVLTMANSTFASSLVGKTVIAATLDSSGKLVKTTGVVEGIKFTNDSFEFIVSGKTFSPENLMEIMSVTTPSTSSGSDTNTPPDTDPNNSET